MSSIAVFVIVSEDESVGMFPLLGKTNCVANAFCSLLKHKLSSICSVLVWVLCATHFICAVTIKPVAPVFLRILIITQLALVVVCCNQNGPSIELWLENLYLFLISAVDSVWLLFVIPVSTKNGVENMSLSPQVRQGSDFCMFGCICWRYLVNGCEVVIVASQR